MACEEILAAPLVPGTVTDPYYLFISHVGANLERAREIARDPSRSYSYRGCNVSGVMGAANTEAGIYEEFDAGNTKARASKDKRCAELKLSNLRNKKGLLSTIGIIIVGPDDDEVISSVMPTPRLTLLPCIECSRLLCEDATMRQNTPIITARLTGNLVEVHNTQEVYDYHEFPGDNRNPNTVELPGDAESLARAQLYLDLRAADQKMSRHLRHTDDLLARTALLMPLD